MTSSSSSSSPSSSLMSSSSFGAGGGERRGGLLGGSLREHRGHRTPAAAGWLGRGLAAAGLGSGLTSDFATGLNPANGPGPFGLGLLRFGLDRGGGRLGRRRRCRGRRGLLGDPLLAGPSARLTSAHATALCSLSRSALGVSGGASKSSSVCLTLGRGHGGERGVIGRGC